MTPDDKSSYITKKANVLQGCPKDYALIHIDFSTFDYFFSIYSKNSLDKYLLNTVFERKVVNNITRVQSTINFPLLSLYNRLHP